MTPKKNRVTKELFLSTMSEGKALFGSIFVFRYINQVKPQYSVVAPKSVAKLAVSRNKLRRQGYNAIRSFCPKQGLGLFFYKKGSAKAEYADIKEDIGSLLKKAHLL